MEPVIEPAKVMEDLHNMINDINRLKKNIHDLSYYAMSDLSSLEWETLDIDKQNPRFTSESINIRKTIYREARMTYIATAYTVKEFIEDIILVEHHIAEAVRFYQNGLLEQANSSISRLETLKSTMEKYSNNLNEYHKMARDFNNELMNG